MGTKKKPLTSNAELGMRSTLEESWPSHRSAKIAPSLSLVPEPELRWVVHEDEAIGGASPPRWNQQPTESGSAALPVVTTSRHLHERHGVHRIDPRSPGHHRYMIAPGVGAVLSPLPRSAGRKRADKPPFLSPTAHAPKVALEDDPAELLFSDIWPSPTVTSRLQDHSTSRTAIGRVARARAGRSSCEPLPTPQRTTANLSAEELSTGRLSGRFYTPPGEESVRVGRTRGRLAYRSPHSLEPLSLEPLSSTPAARSDETQLRSPVMDSPDSPTRARCGKKSARRDWGGGNQILSSTRGKLQRDLSVSPASLSVKPILGPRPDKHIPQQSAPISAVDRWLRTGVFPAQWEETGTNKLPAPRIPSA
eukprot:COSAG02_NODE_8390_length_2587_cov_5.591238_1_plen_364_part_00